MIIGLPPLIPTNPRILILGSMPSVISLSKMHYYGNPRNHFWPIIAKLFEETDTSYSHLVTTLSSHQIALWDVIHSCQRQGSSDVSITDVAANDIKKLLISHQGIRKVLFNGGTAAKCYKKYVGYYPMEVAFITMPSTSPAYTLPFEEKLSAYREALEP